MADDSTVEALRSENASIKAELSALQGELAGAKSRITELNGEAGGHRSNYNREKRAREELQGQLDAVTAERDEANTKRERELEAQRIDLTAKSSDAERRANEAAEKAKSKSIDLDLKATARELGMVDLDGLKLLDRASLTVDDEGSVTNASDILNAFKESKPYFFGAAPKPGTVTGTTATRATPPKPATPSSFDARTVSKEEADQAERALLASLR